MGIRFFDTLIGYVTKYKITTKKENRKALYMLYMHIPMSYYLYIFCFLIRRQHPVLWRIFGMIILCSVPIYSKVVHVVLLLLFRGNAPLVAVQRVIISV